MQSQSQDRGRRRALVVGGSIAGLATTLHLERAGWQVDVFERTAEPLSGRGAGLITHPTLRAALTELGVETSTGFGVDLQERIVIDRNDAITLRRTFPQVSTSWTAVYRALADQLRNSRIHRGVEFISASNTAAGIEALFGDGQREVADVLVGADGVRSRVRAWIADDRKPEYAGYVAWRGMAPEGTIATGVDASRAETFAFCLPPGEQMLGYLVPGADESVQTGHRNYNFVWYRPADHERDLPRLLTDAYGHRHQYAIPPDRLADDVVSQMRTDAERLLAPWFARVVATVAKPFLQPLYDVTVPHMHNGRIALVGDAAFTVRPHVGGGVLKAIDDAAALARALATTPNVTDALAAYSAERCPIGHAMVARARMLGSSIKSTYASEDERRAAAEHADPAAVLRDTANLNFLDVLVGSTNR